VVTSRRQGLRPAPRRSLAPHQPQQSGVLARNCIRRCRRRAVALARSAVLDAHALRRRDAGARTAVQQSSRASC
jgi:hypothetical protein